MVVARSPNRARCVRGVYVCVEGKVERFGREKTVRKHVSSRSINLQLTLSKEVYFINLCTGLRRCQFDCLMSMFYFVFVLSCEFYDFMNIGSGENRRHRHYSCETNSLAFALKISILISARFSTVWRVFINFICWKSDTQFSALTFPSVFYKKLS